MKLLKELNLEKESGKDINNEINFFDFSYDSNKIIFLK